MIPTEKMHRLHIIGDRVLIKPAKEDSKTKSGLFLPPGYKEKEEVRSGYVMKTGRAIPSPTSAMIVMTHGSEAKKINTIFRYKYKQAILHFFFKKMPWNLSIRRRNILL